MDRESLRSLLEAEDVDPAAYSLEGGANDDVYVLEHLGDGWTVYFAERGLRINEERFGSEHEACSRLLERVLRDRTTRRR
jgi:hypothetical protein